MTDPNFIILYVEDATTSTAFYSNLLGKAPVESSPAFAMFVLTNGLKLGLWARHAVVPVTTAAVSSCELVFTPDNDAAVDALHADWLDRGLKIAQTPTRMEFGYTFVALDPDGHRLRVYAPVPA